MHHNFSAQINGSKLFEKVLLPLIILLICAALRVRMGTDSLIVLPLALAQACVGAVVQFFTISYVIRGIRINDTFLEFSGELGEFVKIYLLGSFLSIITLGIYIPWFLRDILRFFTSNTSYQTRPFSFYGTPGGLLAYYFAFLGIYVLIVVAGILVGQASLTLGVVLFAVAIIILASAFSHFVIAWYLQCSFDGYFAKCTAKPSEGVLIIGGQILLTVFTLGLYGPWAYLTFLEFYTKNLTIMNGDRERVFLRFTRREGDGSYMLGQSLLSFITLGIYTPFAIANMGNRLASRFSLETPDAIQITPNREENNRGFY